MTDNVTPIRNSKGQFKKGVSGNPTGRKSIFRDRNGTEIDINELYRRSAGKVFLALLAIIEDPTCAASARVSAIKEFNDRALGKSPNVAVVRTDSGEEFDVSKLDADTLREIVKLKEAAQGGR